MLSQPVGVALGSLPDPTPNEGLEPTPSSLRSASASGRGSGPALACPPAGEVGGEQGGLGQGWAGVRETSNPGDLLRVWRLRGWLGGGRRAVGALGRAAIWDGVTQANNRLHPTPGAYIGWQAVHPSGAGEAWPLGAR
jgi:hypothetical protein